MDEPNTEAEVEATETEAAEPQEQASPEKAKKQKKWVTVGVVVAVIVVAGIGLFAWHNTPSFCNSFCHSPMDYYVESYNTAEVGYGITPHKDEGLSCLSCHEAVPTEQISELMHWVADDYPMNEETNMLATGVEFASEEFCAKSGCHDMQEVVDSTWGFEDNDAKFNPHSSHQDLALECSDCHKVHEKSVLVCARCHDLNLPEGWEAPHDN